MFPILYYCIVEWSDFVLFLIFNIGHIAVNQLFRSSLPKKSFHIPKIRGASKFNILFGENWHIHIFILRQRTIAKKKIWNKVLFIIFRRPPKWAKFVLPIEKANFVLFFSFS